MLGGGGGRSRTGLSGVAQAPAFNRTKDLLFMCLLCISDCLPIFPNRSHDKLISDMLMCVACRRRTCHMLGSISQASAIWSRAVSEAGYEALWSAGLNRHGRGYSHIVLAMKVVGNMAVPT